VVKRQKVDFSWLLVKEEVMSSRFTVKAAPEERAGWFSAISPADYKTKQDKVDRAERFKRERPVQQGFVLNRDYSEPLADDELGDLSMANEQYQNAFQQMSYSDKVKTGRATNKMERRFPSITQEMMSYTGGTGTNQEEGAKAFLDYHFLLNQYQQVVNAEDYHESERAKFARRAAAVGGPGTVEQRERAYRRQFDTIYRMRGENYEYFNESDDE